MVNAIKEPVVHARFFFRNYTILISGKINNIKNHSHHAIQIFFSPKKPFLLTIEGEQVKTSFLIIDKNIKHRVNFNNNNIITMLIDNDSAFAHHITTSILKGRKYLNLDSIPIPTNEIKSKDDASIMFDELFKALDMMGECRCTPKDDRILKTIKIVATLESKKISLKELADQVALSEGRLTHLFKDQVGIPIRKYLLWKRLRESLDIILSGRDMTWAAHQAGFSDSAHLSRTFKETFGINLSKIFKNSQFIQLISMEE